MRLFSISSLYASLPCGANIFFIQYATGKRFSWTGEKNE